MNTAEWVTVALLVVSVVTGTGTTSKRRKTKRKTPAIKRTPGRINRSPVLRADDVILRTPIDDLTDKEFERLWAMYFRDVKRCNVEERGQKGKDGGVDLIVTDRRTKERTAVQIKHWKHKNVGPEVIRELHSARWNTNPRCLWGLLITSADVTKAAREEAAERTSLSYWHGGVLENRLSEWSKWKGSKRKRRN